MNLSLKGSVNYQVILACFNDYFVLTSVLEISS